MKKLLSILLAIGLLLSLSACSGKSSETKEPASNTTETTTSASAEIKMGRATYAAHGTKSFTDVVVAMQGDKIAGVSLDEYQFIDKNSVTGVPNSDNVEDFAASFKDPNVVLASKLENAEYYSKLMTEKAESTTPWDKSIEAIQNFAVGKTVAELETVLSENEAEKMVDVISGATLEDTKGYLAAIVEAAKALK